MLAFAARSSLAFRASATSVPLSDAAALFPLLLLLPFPLLPLLPLNIVCLFSLCIEKDRGQVDGRSGRGGGGGVGEYDSYI